MSRLISNSVRAEVRASLRLATPLIGAQLANVAMGSVDAAFAGRLGPQALAAVAVGVNLNFIFLVFAMGVLMACSPIVAQLRGAGRPPMEAAVFLAQARRLALVIALFWCLALNLIAAPVLGNLGLDEETVRLAIKFEHALSFSAFGYSLWFALRFGAEGAGVMRPILIAGLVGLAANIVLDWLLLFGHFGLPALGAPGCGIATTLSTLLMAFVLHRTCRRSPRLAPYFIASRARRDSSIIDAPGALAVLRLGLPISLILLAEGGAFALCALINARFGGIAAGAYQIAFNIASLAFMIPLGVAQATTVRVGLAAGAGDAAALRFRGVTGMGLALLNAVSNAAIMTFFGGVLVAVYTEDLVIAAQPPTSFSWSPLSSSSTACRLPPTARCAASRTRVCPRRSRWSPTGSSVCRPRRRWRSGSGIERASVRTDYGGV